MTRVSNRPGRWTKVKRTLPGVAAAHADVPNISRLHNIVESLHLDQLCQFLELSDYLAKEPTVSSIGVSGSNLQHQGSLRISKMRMDEVAPVTL